MQSPGLAPAWSAGRCARRTRSGFGRPACDQHVKPGRGGRAQRPRSRQRPACAAAATPRQAATALRCLKTRKYWCRKIRAFDELQPEPQVGVLSVPNRRIASARRSRRMGVGIPVAQRSQLGQNFLGSRDDVLGWRQLETYSISSWVIRIWRTGGSPRHTLAAGDPAQ